MATIGVGTTHGFGAVVSAGAGVAALVGVGTTLGGGIVLAGEVASDGAVASDGVGTILGCGTVDLVGAATDGVVVLAGVVEASVGTVDSMEITTVQMSLLTEVVGRQQELHLHRVP